MVYTDYSLKNHNTFGIDCHSAYFISVISENEAREVLSGSAKLKQPLLIMGGGSNLLFTEDFCGTVIHPEISGIFIEEQCSDIVIVSAGAGVKWDDFVEWCVERGFGGVENLSFIPGNCGAVPVQNIGAYGCEAGEVIWKVRAVSKEDGSIREFSRDDCCFGYRMSSFKREYNGKYLITKVYFRLSLNPVFNLAYGSLKQEVEGLGGAKLGNVRQAVINIRRSKLPDPLETGNAGSFFRNPVVDRYIADKLEGEFPGIPVYDDPSGGKKIAAAWLIEKSGWKGRRIGQAAVHGKQALVIVNLGTATGREIFNLSEEIRKSVSSEFGIDLEREVEIVGSI